MAVGPYIYFKLFSCVNDLKFLNNFPDFRRLILIILLIISIVPNSSCQEYFQQEVNYEIQVFLNDRHHELSAFQTIQYINNSPDTLGFLYFHLWPNAYSGNDTPLGKQLRIQNGKEKMFNDPDLTGYIDSLDFKIANSRVKWNLLKGQPDICQIELNDELKPGDTIIITTPFHVKIPLGTTSRLGHIGESYQVSQWYPKPAVYDLTGWHHMPYLDQGEFYSEFGSFDVSITLPSNYIVAASGELQNHDEWEMLDKLAADTLWKLTWYFPENSFPPSSSELKTLQFKGKQLHDFAWFADKRFHLLKGKIKLTHSGREVITMTMFTNQEAGLWKNSLRYVNNSILQFSEWIGDYPYNSFTAVQSALTAGAGMEYPGLTVIGIAGDAYSLDEVISHEVCHSWFYSAIGSDERKYPFMDESITSAYEMRYMNMSYPGKKLWEIYFRNRKMAKFFHIDKIPLQRLSEFEWLIQARDNLEQPINLPATDYSFINYTDIIYYKAGMALNYLRAYLGDEVFDSIMREYYSDWREKHPMPEDLRIIFESRTDKNLAWFFDDFISTTKRIDYKVLRLEDNKLLIKNKGEMVSPVAISGMNGDSIIFTKWFDGFTGTKWIDIPEGRYSELRIDAKNEVPELFRQNNNIRTSGIFPKTELPRLQLLYTIEDPNKPSVVYVPTAFWTRENGFMVGMTLNNGFILPKRIEYFMMPFISFRNPGIAGFGRIAYNIIPYNNLIRKASIIIEGTKFGAPESRNYYTATAGVNLDFRTKEMVNPLMHGMYGYYISASDLFNITRGEKADMISYLQFGYAIRRTGPLNPFSTVAGIEANINYQKFSIEHNYRYSYNGKDNGLDVRLFGGTMLKNKSSNNFHSLAASGRSGREQYLYEGTYPDRFSVFPETFWSRQMTSSEGGLVSPVNDTLGYSNWLISASFTSTLPGKLSRIPIRPFINVLLNDHGTGTNGSEFFFETGLRMGFRDVLEIYVPLAVSKNIESYGGKIKDRIRIVLNLDFLSEGWR